MSVVDGLIVRRLGRVAYEPAWQAMQRFTAARDRQTPDELWLLEHPPVFTLGLAGKAEHLLTDIGVPLVKTDRGGQITYHGPGQPIIYLLLDLERRHLKVRQLVTHLEQASIAALGLLGVKGELLAGAPGVYVAGAKIAALGLRIKGGCSYHGLSLNVAMDLAPFAAINPCGYEGMPVTQLRDLGVQIDPAGAGELLLQQLQNILGNSHG